MTQPEWLELAVAGVCVVLAALLVAAEAALQSFSRSRAERLVEEGRSGAKKLLTLTQDPAPYLNTTLFLRLFLESVAIVLVALIFFQHTEATWERVLYPVSTMVLVSFIVLGVAPRTLGRQHAEAVALVATGPLSVLTTVLGPIPQLMIWIGNVLTQGRGFTDGFADGFVGVALGFADLLVAVLGGGLDRVKRAAHVEKNHTCLRPPCAGSPRRVHTPNMPRSAARRTPARPGGRARLHARPGATAESFAVYANLAAVPNARGSARVL